MLQVAEGRYLIHFIGHDMDSNEWVDTSRIRFPAGSQLSDLHARLDAGRNLIPHKELMEAEL